MIKRFIFCHGVVNYYLAILNSLPFSGYSGLLKFDMKMFVNIARLDIPQLFIKSKRRGTSMYFGHISSFISVFKIEQHVFPGDTQQGMSLFLRKYRHLYLK